MDNFKIIETDSFLKKISLSTFSSVYQKILSFIYPQLRENPFFGSNIKKLKGELEGVYRYRRGRFRIFNNIDTKKKEIFIVNIDDRKDIYK